MKDLLNAVSNLFKGVAALIVAGLVAFGSWLGYDAYTGQNRLSEKLEQSEAAIKQKTAEIEKLGKVVAEKEQQIETLDTALRLMKIDHRLAEIMVVKQWKSDLVKKADGLETTFVFQEVDDAGHPLAKPQQFTIVGDILYIDALVIKWNDNLVERGDDPLRSSAICLIRRVFGEFQEPNDGFVIDSVNSRPTAYGNNQPLTEFQKELWTNFWDYANDPAKCEKAKIRSAHGDAKFIKLRPGLLYKLKLRADGDMWVETTELPPDKAKAL